MLSKGRPFDFYVCVCWGWGERGECFRSWIFLFNRDASPFFYSRFTTRTIALTLILAFFGVCVCGGGGGGVGEGERGDKRGSCIY